jgi:hypothetical protein
VRQVLTLCAFGPSSGEPVRHRVRAARYALSAAAGATGSDVRYSGIWRQLKGTWVMDVNMTSSAFRLKNYQYTLDGYDLHRVQGYDNGTRFLAVWRKPPERARGPIRKVGAPIRAPIFN